MSGRTTAQPGQQAHRNDRTRFAVLRASEAVISWRSTRRHSSAILSSPRKPARTIRIFSSAEYCLRVARRMALMTFSASSFF